MRFHVLTIFPEFFRGPFEHGVIQRAHEAGLIEIRIHDLRHWTHDRHRTVDDRPFGGGEGMLLKPGPIFEAVESIWPERHAGQKVVLLSAQGRRFNQALAREFSGCEELLLICGRYEGVDERVAEHLADEEVSIGDYVLSGGELAAAVVIDAVARLQEGVLGNQDSARTSLIACSMSSVRFWKGAGSGARVETPRRSNFWIAPSTRGPRSTGDGRFRTSCWAGTTRKFGAGGDGRDGKEPRAASDLTEMYAGPRAFVALRHLQVRSCVAPRKFWAGQKSPEEMQ